MLVEKARTDAAAFLNRVPQADARPVLVKPDASPRPGFDIVAPLRSLEVSHLLASLDRRRATA